MPLTSPTLFTPFFTGAAVVTPPVFISGPVATDGYWTVVHYNHDEIALGETIPSDLEFGYKHSELAYCNYNLNKADPLAVIEKTEAYVTDFKLFRDTTNLLGGLHTSVELDHEPGGTIRVSGKEWLHYFERRFYPFNPNATTPQGYAAIGVDIFQIFRELVNNTLAEPNSLTGVTFSAEALAPSGILGDFRIEPGDVESLFSKLNAVSDLDPGFDIEMTPDKEIRLFSPKRHDLPSSYTFELGVNVKSLSLTDRGPDGNHLVASATRGSSTVIRTLDNLGAAEKFRRLDFEQNFSTVQTLNALDRQSQIELGRGSAPVYDLIITVDPDYFEDVWLNLRPTYSCHLIADLGYKVIDQNYQVVTMTGRLPSSGNESLELAFNA